MLKLLLAAVKFLHYYVGDPFFYAFYDERFIVT